MTKSPAQYEEYKWKDHERKAAMKAAEQCLNSSTNSTPKKFSKHLEKQNIEPTNTYHEAQKRESKL